MADDQDPLSDWFWNPANPASPLSPLFHDDSEDEEDDSDEYMDSGSQFGHRAADSGGYDNWTTTGQDSDYIDDDEVSDQGGSIFPVTPFTPPEPVHKNSTSIFEDMWAYLKKKFLG